MDPISFEEISVRMRIGDKLASIMKDVDRRKLMYPLTNEQISVLSSLGGPRDLLLDLQRADRIAPRELSDAVARRNGLQKAHTPAMIPLAQVDPVAGARFAVFNYMIGNLDWSMRAGPPEEGCCHNGRTISLPEPWRSLARKRIPRSPAPRIRCIRSVST